MGRSIVKVTITGQGMTVESSLVLLSSMSASWKNQDDSMDVDDNGSINPLDVFAIINAINSRGTRRLNNQKGGDRVLGFVDVNDDRFLDPVDVLEVVNHVKRRW